MLPVFICSHFLNNLQQSLLKHSFGMLFNACGIISLGLIADGPCKRCCVPTVLSQ